MQRTLASPAARQATALRTRWAAPAALAAPRVPRAPARGARLMASASLDAVKEKIAAEKVVIFSKSYCPYCVSVKALMTNVGVKPTVIELDEVAGGAEMQAALQELTKQRTVPNVFVGGKHVGGNDACQALHQEKKLVPMLQAAGAL